jgi:hypothetical protein
MEFPYECLTRGGGRAIIYTEAGEQPFVFVGAYWTGDGWVPAAWLSTGRRNENKFTALDLLLDLSKPASVA